MQSQLLYITYTFCVRPILIYIFLFIDFYRLVLQHLRTIEEELKEVKQQVAVNTAMIQRLGGGGVADLGLVEDTNMPLSNAEDLDELERRLISDVDLKNQLVCLFKCFAI